MRNIGTGEILVMMVLALIVIGPKRLPEIARNLGKAWRTFQAESEKAKSLFRDVIDESQVSLYPVAEPASGGAAPAPAVAPRAQIDPTIRRFEDT